MEDRNQPVPRSCPHCGAAAKLMPSAGDYEIYVCPYCGYYRVSGINQKLIANGVVGSESRPNTLHKDGNRWLRPGQYRSYRSGLAPLALMTGRGEGQLKGADHRGGALPSFPGEEMLVRDDSFPPVTRHRTRDAARQSPAAAN